MGTISWPMPLRAAPARRWCGAQQVADLDPGRPFAVVDATGAGLEGATPATVLLIAVDDPLAALQRLAAYHRGLFTPKVIGITGSVGKTSTKEVTAAVLRRRFSTLKNPRSYNTESTLPISLLQLEAHHEVAVLEMGAYGPGDISLLAGIARPHIGIVTNIGPSHMERMGSLETVAQAKSELVQALPADGYAILNIDDPRVRAMAERHAGAAVLLRARPGRRPVCRRDREPRAGRDRVPRALRRRRGDAEAAAAWAAQRPYRAGGGGGRAAAGAGLGCDRRWPAR